MCDGVEPGHRMHYHPRAQTWMDNYWATSISESRNVNLKRPRWRYRSDRAGDKEVRVNYNRNPGKFRIGSLTCHERMSNFNQSSWGTWVCRMPTPPLELGLGLKLMGYTHSTLLVVLTHLLSGQTFFMTSLSSSFA